MSFLITGILFIAGKELLMPGNHPAIPTKTIAENTAQDKADKKAETDAVSSGFSILKIPYTPQKLLSATENKLAAVTLPEETEADGQVDIAVIPLIPLSIQKEGPEQQAAPRSGSTEENSNGLIENFAPGSSNAISKASLPVAKEPADREIKSVSATNRAIKRQDAEDQNEVNWLEQYASFELKSPIKNGSRVNWQVYMSPTVNYRTLSGGEPFTVPKSGVQYVPIALTHTGSPNDYVIHKAAMGYEAGGSLLYRVTRNFTLKAGLQFNYSRYDIKAYTSSNSQQATIALNTSYGGYNPNVISGLSNIQNFGGNQVTDLYNHYYQLSVPLGFELRIFGNERIQFNIAATIQPSYLINRNNYLLTTDYSDYTKVPSLFRKWNFDGGVEAFVSYKIAGLRWQVGPELRYQMLSSYTTQYPIRENLKAYGLKIGVSKTIW